MLGFEGLSFRNTSVVVGNMNVTALSFLFIIRDQSSVYGLNPESCGILLLNQVQ